MNPFMSTFQLWHSWSGLLLPLSLCRGLLTCNESVYTQFVRNGLIGCTNQVAVFQLEKLLGTLVLVHRVVVLNNAFAIYRSLIGRFKTASQPLRTHNG